MTSKKHVLEAALQLSEKERLEVVERLYKSLDEFNDPEADEAWDREIKRRLKLVKEGKAKFLTWDEALRVITEGGDGSKKT